MERYEILNTLLRPADLLIGANFSLLRKAGLYDKLQDGAYWSVVKLMRANFERSNDLEVLGLENLPEGGVVLASNHQSWYDVQVLAGVFPRRVHFMAKAEFEHWPLMRHMVDLSQGFYVRRGGGDPAGLNTAEAILAGGGAVALYPEGTIPGEEDVPRSQVEPATALLRGHTGMVRLALAAGVPIVPVSVSGASSAFPPEMFPRLELAPLPTKARITIRFGAPIHLDPPAGDAPTREELRERTDLVMARISDGVDHHRQWVPLARFRPELLAAPAAGAPRMGALLLHGFTSSVQCVDALIPVFERHGIPWRRPVLRGHGTVYTDLKGVHAGHWIEDAQDALHDLLEDCDQVVVVGLSMGGLVALELAARYPEKVAGVAGLAPALRFANPFAAATGLLAKVVPYWPSPNSYRDRKRAEANQNYPRFATDAFASLLALGEMVEQRLPEVKAPLLLVHSRRDQVVSPEASEIIHAKAGSEQKELVWFHRSGHELLLDLEAEAVVPIVEEFLLQRRLALASETPA